MKIFITIFALISLASTTRGESFDLCLLYDPDAPTKGVVVLQPRNGHTRIMLAESVKIQMSNDVTTITVNNFTMLAESDIGTQYIMAGTTQFQYGTNIGKLILVNNYPCLTSRAHELFPIIPGKQAKESLRLNPTPLKWGNIVEGGFITAPTKSKTRIVEQSARPYDSPAAGSSSGQP